MVDVPAGAGAQRTGIGERAGVCGGAGPVDHPGQGRRVVEERVAPPAHRGSGCGVGAGSGDGAADRRHIRCPAGDDRSAAAPTRGGANDWCAAGDRAGRWTAGRVAVRSQGVGSAGAETMARAIGPVAGWVASPDVAPAAAGGGGAGFPGVGGGGSGPVAHSAEPGRSGGGWHRAADFGGGRVAGGRDGPARRVGWVRGQHGGAAGTGWPAGGHGSAGNPSDPTGHSVACGYRRLVRSGRRQATALGNEPGGARGS